MRLERGNGLWADVYSGLRTHPGRTALSVAAIGLGLFALSLLLAMLAGLRERANRLTADFGADVIALTAPGAHGNGLSDAHVRRLRANLPGAAVSGIRRMDLPLAEGGASLRVAAVDADWFRVRPAALAAGRILDGWDDAVGERHAVAGAGLAARFGVRPGDILQLRGLPLTLVGVLAAGSGGPGDIAAADLPGGEALYVPRNAAPHGENARPDAARRLDAILVRAPDAERLPSTLATARRLLRQPDLPAVEPAWITADSLLVEIRKLQRLLRGAFGGIAVLCLLSGAATLTSLLLANVRDRTAEIGLRRALGATPGNIAALFIAEALALAAAAAGLAALAARAASPLAQRFGPAPVVWGPEALFGPLAAALVLAAICAGWPARLAARLPPADALRREF